MLKDIIFSNTNVLVVDVMVIDKMEKFLLNYIILMELTQIIVLKTSNTYVLIVMH